MAEAEDFLHMVCAVKTDCLHEFVGTEVVDPHLSTIDIAAVLLPDRSSALLKNFGFTVASGSDSIAAAARFELVHSCKSICSHRT